MWRFKRWLNHLPCRLFGHVPYKTTYTFSCYARRPEDEWKQYAKTKRALACKRCGDHLYPHTFIELEISGENEVEVYAPQFVQDHR